MVLSQLCVSTQERSVKMFLYGGTCLSRNQIFYKLKYGRVLIHLNKNGVVIPQGGDKHCEAMHFKQVELTFRMLPQSIQDRKTEHFKP